MPTRTSCVSNASTQRAQRGMVSKILRPLLRSITKLPIVSPSRLWLTHVLVCEELPLVAGAKVAYPVHRVARWEEVQQPALGRGAVDVYSVLAEFGGWRQLVTTTDS